MYPPEVPDYIVDKFNRAVAFMEQMKDIRDIYAYPGFNPKMKHGKRAGHRAINLNQQWRLLFCLDKTSIPHSIIVDYVDNGHYKP